MQRSLDEWEPVGGGSDSTGVKEWAEANATVAIVGDLVTECLLVDEDALAIESSDGKTQGLGAVAADAGECGAHIEIVNGPALLSNWVDRKPWGAWPQEAPADSTRPPELRPRVDGRRTSAAAAIDRECGQGDEHRPAIAAGAAMRRGASHRVLAALGGALLVATTVVGRGRVGGRARADDQVGDLSGDIERSKRERAHV